MAYTNLRQAESGPLDRQKVDLGRQLLTQDAEGGTAAPKIPERWPGGATFGAPAPLFRWSGASTSWVCHFFV